MIDPYSITNHARSRAELEEFWVFCLSVAGKKATMMADKVDAFISGCGAEGTPFQRIRRLISEDRLVVEMRRARVGKYALLDRALRATVADGAPDIETAGPSELETIPGVGPKTARFFLLHSRRDVEVAVIDTHMVKYVAALGHRVPNGVPTGKEYARLERIVIDRARSLGLPLDEFDLAVWSHYASGGVHPLPGAAA